MAEYVEIGERLPAHIDVCSRCQEPFKDAVFSLRRKMHGRWFVAFVCRECAVWAGAHKKEIRAEMEEATKGANT